MKKLLLGALAVISTCFSSTGFTFQIQDFLPKKDLVNHYYWLWDELLLAYDYPQSSLTPIDPFYDIHQMLLKESETLNMPVIDKVLTTLKCASRYHVEHNNILTIIDYSLPSNVKRLWVFDLQDKKLLFHTYVSHGIKSGALLTNYFSNINNSKASSLGVYKTEKTYYGRDGLSLRLDGLDKGFNDQASNRYVVMHGGWYVDESFIKKYGRPGRSWGCPALPPQLTKPIINTIKDNSFFIVYYPSDKWFSKSKFLNCNKPFITANNIQSLAENKAINPQNETREDVLFAKMSKSGKGEESDAVLVMSADNYERVFHTKAPLERMLRRQINNAEYVALSHTEFKTMLDNQNRAVNNNEKNELNNIQFVSPVIKMQGGYYATLMKILDLGKIKEVHLNSMSNTKSASVTVVFESKPSINLIPTNRFVRWLGL